MRQCSDLKLGYELSEQQFDNDMIMQDKQKINKNYLLSSISYQRNCLTQQKNKTNVTCGLEIQPSFSLEECKEMIFRNIRSVTIRENETFPFLPY